MPTLENAIDFYAPDAQPTIRAAVAAGARDGTPWDLELPFVTAKGNPRWVRAQGIAAIEDGRPVRLLGAFQDITEKMTTLLEMHRLNEQLTRLSTTDALTEVGNRRMFDQTLKTEWARAARRGEPVGLLMIDIDHFKEYNDHYGHPAGDVCLRQVARMVGQSMRRGGELVARYGGEEFALLLPGADLEDTRRAAERCAQIVADAKIEHRASATSAWLTISIGAASQVAAAPEPTARRWWRPPTPRCIAPSAAAGRGSSSEPRRSSPRPPIAPRVSSAPRGGLLDSADAGPSRRRGHRVSRLRLSRFLPSVVLVLVLVLGAALAGCSSLPPLPERHREHGDDRHRRHHASASWPPPAWSRPAPANRAFACCRPATSPSMPGWRWRDAPSARSTSSTTTSPTTASACSSCARCATPPGAACACACSSTTSTPAARTSCSAASPRSPTSRCGCSTRLPSRGGSVLSRVVWSAHEFSRINLRMHNKLFVADNRFSVSGGRNMADEYFMRSNEANFIDMDVISAGPIVRDLSQVFDRYWNSALAYPIEPVMLALAPSVAASASAQRFDELVLAAPPELLPANHDPLGRASVDYEFSAGRIALEFAAAAVLADTPNKGALRNPGDTLSTVNRSVLEELAAAHSELLIASPYFIPGKVGMERLREVIDRKVRIRVVTNGIGATDEPLVHWRYARYRLNMLKMGIELYEVSPTLARDVGVFGIFGLSFRRLHAKVAAFDNQRVFIGSMNFDPRSAWSNTESGLLIESSTMAHQVHNLLADEHNAGVYRLRLAADGETIEWWSMGADGKMHFTTEEPDNTWTLQMQQMLLEPLVAEELL